MIYVHIAVYTQYTKFRPLSWLYSAHIGIEIFAKVWKYFPASDLCILREHKMFETYPFFFFLKTYDLAFGF